MRAIVCESRFFGHYNSSFIFMLFYDLNSKLIRENLSEFIETEEVAKKANEKKKNNRNGSKRIKNEQ